MASSNGRATGDASMSRRATAGHTAHRVTDDQVEQVVVTTLETTPARRHALEAPARSHGRRASVA